MPELRHSSEKARTRAVSAIRRREAEEEIEEEQDKIDDGPPVRIWRVFKLVKPEIRRLTVGLVAVTVSSLATMAFPTAVGMITSHVGRNVIFRIVSTIFIWILTFYTPNGMPVIQQGRLSIQWQLQMHRVI